MVQARSPACWARASTSTMCSSVRVRRRWQNLFYGAPLGAPMAILLAGLLGSAAEAVRDNPAHRARVFGLPAGRLLSAISGLGLLGTTAEAGLLHFRGAFHDPAMFAPVTIPPAGGALLLNAAYGAENRDRWLARWWLRLSPARACGASGSTPGACSATWVAGGTGARTCSMAHRYRRRPASLGSPWPGWRRSDCSTIIPMAERYPGYDVLAKRTTPSWNAQTRRVVDQRLAVPREPRFFTADEFRRSTRSPRASCRSRRIVRRSRWRR